MTMSQPMEKFRMILDTNSSFRRLVAVIGIALGIATAIAAVSTSISHALELPNFVGEPKELSASLRAGGYVILLRHGATFSDQADTDPFNLADISNQRNLN